jgi:hypothetical protein
MQLSLEIQNLPEICKWVKHEKILKELSSRFKTMTKLQANFMAALGRDKHSIFIENHIKNGKSTALIFYMIHKILKTAETSKKGSDVPSFVFLFPNASFVEKFRKKIESFNKLFDSLNCEVLYENEKQNRNLPNSKIRFFFVTTQECIKMLKEERIFLKEIQGLLVDDLDYLVSFGQTNNLMRLINFFKAKSTNFFSLRDFIVITNEDLPEETARIRKDVEVPFFKLLMRKEIKPVPEKIEEEENEEITASANLAKAIFNQYFFINSETNGFSLLYLIAKFEVFPQGTMIVTQNISEAYRILMFIERAGLGLTKIYNPGHPITLKAYNVSLFNSNQAKILVTTQDFLKDYQKNKEKVSVIKGLRNIIFFKSEVGFSQYSEFLEVLQGNQNYYVPGTSFDFNILFIVPNDIKYNENVAIDEGQTPVQEEVEIQNPFSKKFYELIAEQEVVYNRIIFEPMTIDIKDIEMFSYRMETLINTLTFKQVKVFRLVEMQKLILKSKKMKEYFNIHPNEKELVLVKLNRFSKQLKQNELRLPKNVPEYLIPTFVKEEAENRNQKIRAKRANSIKNNQKMQDPKQVRKVYATENPVISDPKQLRTFSSHKIWKIRHRKIKKFQDKKKIIKGIYNI